MSDVDLATQQPTVFRGVKDGVDPWPIEVGGEKFVFSRRPSAKQQLDAMKLAINEDTGITQENVDVVLDIVAAMLEDGHADLDRLLVATDLEEVVDIMGKAMEKMSARPTTESSDS